MHTADFEAREQQEQITAHLLKIRETGTILFESVHRRKDGTLWPVEVNVAYWPRTGGRLMPFLRDITGKSSRGRDPEPQRQPGAHGRRGALWNWNPCWPTPPSRVAFVDGQLRFQRVNRPWPDTQGSRPRNSLAVRSANSSRNRPIRSNRSCVKSSRLDGPSWDWDMRFAGSLRLTVFARSWRAISRWSIPRET